MSERLLRGFTIYERPLDFPDGYVVRGWTTYRGQPKPEPDRVASYHSSLVEARCAVPRGLYRLQRMPDDDRAILEVWI